MTYIAADDRYSIHPYRRCGRSGVKLPEVSLRLCGFLRGELVSASRI